MKKFSEYTNSKGLLLYGSFSTPVDLTNMVEGYDLFLVCVGESDESKYSINQRVKVLRKLFPKYARNILEMGDDLSVYAKFLAENVSEVEKVHIHSNDSFISECIRTGNFQPFRDYFSGSTENINDIFNDIRESIGYERCITREHIRLPKVSDVREKYVTGEYLKEGDLVSVEGGKLGSIVKLGPNFVVVDTGKEEISCWLNQVKRSQAD
jgi:hypothetical protein